MKAGSYFTPAADKISPMLKVRPSDPVTFSSTNVEFLFAPASAVVSFWLSVCRSAAFRTLPAGESATVSTSSDDFLNNDVCVIVGVGAGAAAAPEAAAGFAP